MKLSSRLRFLPRCLTLALALGRIAQAEPGDLDTRLMLATLKLSNPDSAGTAFVLTRPDPTDPKAQRSLLVTAEHVFARMKGDEATIHFRRRGAEGDYAKAPAPLKVRREGKALWTKHPTADVAVMDLSTPPEVDLSGVPIDFLASDADLDRHEVHPGDLVRCVGFPYPNQFQANDPGFAVVRLGCIASYPLRPTAKTKTFLCDLNSFEGDSGSPVYLAENRPTPAGKDRPGRVELVLGLVVAQHFIDEEFKTIYQSGKLRHRIGMGIVVHATAIREAINLLPRDP